MSELNEIWSSEGRSELSGFCDRQMRLFVTLTISPRIICTFWCTLRLDLLSWNRDSAYRKTNKSQLFLFFIKLCKEKWRLVIVNMSVISYIAILVIFVAGATSHSSLAIASRDDISTSWIANLVFVFLCTYARAFETLDKKYESTVRASSTWKQEIENQNFVFKLWLVDVFKVKRTARNTLEMVD